LHYTHLPHPFSISSTLPLIPEPPDRTCSALLSWNFVKKKNDIFCLFKIATQGVSLWHFHVCMYFKLKRRKYFFLIYKLLCVRCFVVALQNKVIQGWGHKLP
jgi:hypothetical protein